MVEPHRARWVVAHDVGGRYGARRGELGRPDGALYRVPTLGRAGPLDLRPRGCLHLGYLLKAGQLEYDCRYSKMHGMPVTGGRGFRSVKLLWYKGVPP